MSRPGSLNMAELKRAARRIGTIAELTERVVRLESAIAALAARLQRLEAARANGVREDRREGESEYDISSLIG